MRVWMLVQSSHEPCRPVAMRRWPKPSKLRQTVEPRAISALPKRRSPVPQRTASSGLSTVWRRASRVERRPTAVPLGPPPLPCQLPVQAAIRPVRTLPQSTRSRKACGQTSARSTKRAAQRTERCFRRVLHRRAHRQRLAARGPVRRGRWQPPVARRPCRRYRRTRPACWCRGREPLHRLFAWRLNERIPILRCSPAIRRSNFRSTRRGRKPAR